MQLKFGNENGLQVVHIFVSLVLHIRSWSMPTFHNFKFGIWVIHFEEDNFLFIPKPLRFVGQNQFFLGFRKFQSDSAPFFQCESQYKKWHRRSDLNFLGWIYTFEISSTKFFLRHCVDIVMWKQEYVQQNVEVNSKTIDHSNHMNCRSEEQTETPFLLFK